MINDTELMSSLLNLRDTSKSAMVQRRAKDAIADVRRARTLLAKAIRIRNWCAVNKHKSAEELL